MSQFLIKPNKERDCSPPIQAPKIVEEMPLRDLLKTSTGVAHHHKSSYPEPEIRKKFSDRPIPPKLLKKSDEVPCEDHFASTAQKSFNRKSIVEYSDVNQKYPISPSCTEIDYLRPYCDSFKNVPRAFYRIDLPASETEYHDMYQEPVDNIWNHPSILSSKEILHKQPECVKQLSLPKPILEVPVANRTVADELDFSRSTTHKDHCYFTPKLLKEKFYQNDAVTIWNSRNDLFADKWRSSIKPHYMHLTNIMADRKKQPMIDKHLPELKDGKWPPLKPLAGSGKSEMQEAYVPKQHDMTDHFIYPPCPEDLRESGFKANGMKEIVPRMYETIASSIGSSDMLIL